MVEGDTLIKPSPGYPDPIGCVKDDRVLTTKSSVDATMPTVGRLNAKCVDRHIVVFGHIAEFPACEQSWDLEG